MKAFFLLLLQFGFLMRGYCFPAQDPEVSFDRFVNTGEFNNGDISIVSEDPLLIARDYIQAHLEEWGLTPQDIEEMTINDMYTDKTSGITRIYFLQQYRNIPVYNAILNVSITKEGHVFFAGNRFVRDLENKINTTVPELSPELAVINLARHLGLEIENLLVKRQTAPMQFVFDKGRLAKEDITATLRYQPHQGSVLLAWDILLSPVGNKDKWSTRVDATTGAILNEYNWTVYCHADEHMFARENYSAHDHYLVMEPAGASAMDVAQYSVWPAPIASPDHGPRVMVTNPADPDASPFGWHDIDGHLGPEFTITRGNNVHAFQDRDNIDQSSQDEPDGGPDLHFNFPFDPSWEPEQYIDAAVVNLFYWTNYMHDFAYYFGFDEAAGNFQQNNYGNGGLENDYLIVTAQDGADAGVSNNANYTHSNDGESSTLNMYVFQKPIRYLTVNEPSSIAGRYETGFVIEEWGDGAHVTNIPVTGEVVLVNDGVEDPFITDGCEEIINASELAGKIALFDRGGCPFSYKAWQAQNAGAIGVIMCNYNDEYFNMTPGSEALDVQIPIVMIGAANGQLLRQFAGSGLSITLVDPGPGDPAALDSDFENALIVHEYGHGIAWRLAGGPNAACFDNAEQMSEGWSDFFALATTVQPGDKGEERRGFCTYVSEEQTTGRGLRRNPYSTDMDIMPLTFGDVAPIQEVHDLGEVWAAALWDMYWALVDRYGWSADIYDPASGNNKAIRLVFDGLKNVPCSPGFVDARDAILAADESLYNGENVCLLWEVFARRGLGYSADQGSPFDAGDQREAFDVSPLCTNRIIIEKSVTDFIQPGNDIQVTLKVSNYKAETATNLVVTDEIPAGTSLKPNSASLPPVVQGNSVSFHLEDLNFKEEKTIQYQLQTTPEAWSQRLFLDDVDAESDTNWLSYALGFDGPNHWAITDEFPGYTGNHAWMSTEVSEKSLQVLELNPDVYTFHVEGHRPVMRFYHRYQTQAGINGGIVEVREAGTTAWEQVGEDILRNGYRGEVGYQAFSTPGINAFSGNHNDAYRATYVNLSRWAGKNIHVRFRFGITENTNGGTGWCIDDIEFMDMLSYNAEVCVTSDQGDYECTTAPEAGTIVDSREDPVSVLEEGTSFPIMLYPNPAKENISVMLPDDLLNEVKVSLLTIDGKTVMTKSYTPYYTTNLNLDIRHVPAGVYYVKVSTMENHAVGRVIIQD